MKNDLFPFEAKFKDGKKIVVHELTFSRACVLAAYVRMALGDCTHRQLTVIGGRRVP